MLNTDIAALLIVLLLTVFTVVAILALLAGKRADEWREIEAALDDEDTVELRPLRTNISDLEVRYSEAQLRYRAQKREEIKKTRH